MAIAESGLDGPHERRYWRVIAGNGQGKLWDWFREQSLIAVEWQGSPDLRRISPGNQGGFKVELAGKGFGTTGVYPAHKQLWSFYAEMHPADLVAVYGNGQVLGWGEIIGEYEFEQDQAGFPHRRAVVWHQLQPFPVSQLSKAVHGKLVLPPTILSLSQTEFEEIQQGGLNVIANEVNARTAIAQSLATQGLSFTPWQIATFYTALQTKGFVILSGISGTGKTKLAQHFAEMLPQPTYTQPLMPSDVINITIQPYMLKYGLFIIPKQAERVYVPPAPGKTQEVTLRFGEQTQSCKLVHLSNANNDIVRLFLRGTVKQWFVDNFVEGDTLVLEPILACDLTVWRLSGIVSGRRLLFGGTIPPL